MRLQCRHQCNISFSVKGFSSGAGHPRRQEPCEHEFVIAQDSATMTDQHLIRESLAKFLYSSWLMILSWAKVVRVSPLFCLQQFGRSCQCFASILFPEKVMHDHCKWYFEDAKCLLLDRRGIVTVRPWSIMKKWKEQISAALRMWNWYTRLLLGKIDRGVSVNAEG